MKAKQQALDAAINAALPNLFKYWTAVIIFIPLMAKAASTLHIEGTASYTTYGTDGTVLSSFDGGFSLVTDFSQWKVKYIDDQNKTEQETTFDGNLTYTLYANFPLANIQATNSPIPNEVIVTNGQYKLNADVAGVDTSWQPVALFASGQVAWMNLLACGLISNPRPQLIPPWLTVASGEASSYKSRIHDESTADRDCCAQIEFVTSQKLWAATKKGSPSQANPSDVPKEDFVEARFRVLSWTNVQNKCVPLEAEFVRFWYPNIQKKTRKPMRSVIRTTVSKHYFASETISPPALSKKTYVSDTRFKTPDAPNFTVHYALTSQTWVDERDPRLARWVQESMTNYLRMQAMIEKETRKPSANRRLAFIVLTLIVLAGPVVMFLLKRDRIPQNQNQR